MNALTRKLVTLTGLSVLPLAIIVVRSFLLTRRGWHTPEIQFQAIYWLARAMLAPALLLYIVKNWHDTRISGRLISRLLAGFILYTIIHWGLSFAMSKILMPAFDPRNWNLFNIIKNESSQLNFVLFFGSVLILYLWVYIDRERASLYESADLKLRLARFEAEQHSRERQVESTLNVITVKTGSKVKVIPLEQIFFFQANGPYVNVVIDGATHLLNRPLYELQAALPDTFLRIHRSCIVNLRQILEAKSLLNGDYELTLKNGHRIRASRTYREDLRAALGKL
ncbi:MAG TPA: LytTR family DNA-binding domain-containing protein [Cyclobacteriaceae bacterium]|nr:LytTR family DNA-binding domain-containing protein [Cyclobacteriaceae bacterium]